MKIGITTSNVPDFLQVAVNAILKKAVQNHAEEALDIVRGVWPEDTGKSEAAWDSRVTQSENTTTLTLFNTAPYAQYVHLKGSTTPLVPSLPVKALTVIQPAVNSDASRDLAYAFENAPRRIR